MTGLINYPAFTLFVPQQGFMLWIYIITSLLIGLAFLFMLTKIPNRYRKPIVVAITFIMGWFYFLEFMIPGNAETAPARGRLIAAERDIQVAKQNLGVLAKQDRGKWPSDVGSRIGRARNALDDAVAGLRVAKSEMDRLRPIALQRYEAESARAESFATHHNLQERMLDRDGGEADGKINNARTKSLRKRVDELTNSSSKIEEVVVGIESIRSALAGPDVENMAALNAEVAGAAESVTLVVTEISDNFLTPYKEPMANALQVLGAFALGLGVYSLASIHGKMIVRRRPGWYNSLAFYIALVAIMAFGFMQRSASAGSPAQSLGTTMYNILFQGGLASLQAAMFSLVAFYIVSAAYRAFRIRSNEAALMMVSAFLVMLSIVPIGVWLTSGLPGFLAWLRLENIGDWIMTVPNTAAQRGIAFGIGVGGLAMALRIWLSLERGSYFDKQM